MKKIIWIVLGVVAVLIAMAIYGFATGKFEPLFKNRASSSSPISQSQNRETANQNCTKNPQPVFTANFIDTTKINSLGPIGGITVGSPARSYIGAQKDTSNQFVSVPIYAPADAVLEGIVFARRNPNDPTAPGEYRLDFRASCEVTYHFDHLDELSDVLKPHAPVEPANHTREAKAVSVAVKAGDSLAFSNGTSLAGTFDFYLINTNKEVPHINPSRWQWEQTTIADCPYDYFTEALKSQYYDMLRSQDGAKLISPSCGSPSHDIAGTASGGWFKDESTDNQGQWLEIGNINGRAELNLRDTTSSTPFMIRDYKAKTLPDTLTVGNTVCYSDGNNWGYIKLNSETELSFAKGAGNCPSTLPAEAEIWQR